MLDICTKLLIRRNQCLMPKELRLCEEIPVPLWQRFVSGYTKTGNATDVGKIAEVTLKAF